MNVKVDPRGPRFGAVITSTVLAVILLTTPSTLATALLILQTVVFGLGAFAGLQFHPYGWIYRTFVRPRLAAPTELEDSAPLRFAQLVGFLFAAVGLVGTLTGSATVALVAVGLALGAAFLNAAFNICLGCEMYLLGKRIASR
ncbi:MAG: hypothetical protein RIS61_1090 [Actinomycetota bacterium]|jgi:hypothetical protein